MEAVATASPMPGRMRTRRLARWWRMRSLTMNLLQCILLVLSLTICCVVFVRARAQVLHERYLLEEAQREQERLQMENRTLRLTWATYTSPKLLEEAARKRFHLHYPRPNEVVRVP
jgi:cell division protein FtsL